jgi:hypothetical protein
LPNIKNNRKNFMLPTDDDIEKILENVGQSKEQESISMLPQINMKK